MKKLLSILLLGLSLNASSYESGLKAYQNGDLKKAFNIWKDLAKKGEARAQYGIGIMYLNGEGIKKDKFKSFYWFKKGAENGLVISQYALANRYRNGEGTYINIDKAIEWFKKSEKKFIPSKTRLSEIYCNGDRDLRKCKDYLLDAKRSGDRFASMLWDIKRFSEINIEDEIKLEKKKNRESFEKNKPLAIKGDSTAQLELGKSFLNGKGVTKDLDKALYWFKEASKKGNEESNALIAMMYLEGNGVKRDYNEGIKWLKKTPINSHFVYSSLSSLNENKDEYEKSFQWVKRKAREGDKVAQCGLAHWYEFELKDLNKSLKWYKKSAENNHAEAQYILGTLYYFGNSSTKKDIKKSLKWYKKAIENGHSGAKKAWKDFDLDNI